MRFYCSCTHPRPRMRVDPHGPGRRHWWNFWWASVLSLSLSLSHSLVLKKASLIHYMFRAGQFRICQYVGTGWCHSSSLVVTRSGAIKPTGIPDGPNKDRGIALTAYVRPAWAHRALWIHLFKWLPPFSKRSGRAEMALEHIPWEGVHWGRNRNPKSMLN